MSNATSPVVAVYRDKAHRTSCKRIAGKPVETDELSNVVGDDKVTPASCCKPEKTAEWKAAAQELDVDRDVEANEEAELAPETNEEATEAPEFTDGADDAEEPATEQSNAPKARKAHADKSTATTIKDGKAWKVEVNFGGAKHFWLGLGRNVLEALQANGYQVEISNKERAGIVLTDGKADAKELAEDIPAAYAAAAEALVQWRATQRVHGYQALPLRQRIDADRDFLSDFAAGYVAHAYGVEFDQKRYDVQDGYHAGVTAAH